MTARLIMKLRVEDCGYDAGRSAFAARPSDPTRSSKLDRGCAHRSAHCRMAVFVNIPYAATLRSVQVRDCH